MKLIYSAALAISLLFLQIQLIETKKWKEFYSCQEKCIKEKECDGKCAKDFNQKCNIFKEGLIGEESSCKWIKKFWDNQKEKIPEDDQKISEIYGEKWINCYGHCINKLEDGYSVAYAECYQSCNTLILQSGFYFLTIVLAISFSLLM